MRNVSAFQPNTASGTTKAYYPLNGNPAGSLKDSLIASYRLEDVSDSFGSYALTNTGSVPFNAGKIGNGADFTPNDSLNNNSVLGATSYPRSFAGWAKFDTITGDDRTIFSLSDGSVHYYVLKVRDSDDHIVFRSNNTTQAGDIDTGITASTGTWYHWAVVQNSATSVTIYINNVETNTAASTFTATVSQFYLGYLGRSSVWWLDGIIDEVGIWNRALTADEISRLYNAGNGQQLETRALDYSGNGNHGTETAVTYPQGRFGQGARFNGSTSKIQLPTTLYDFNSDTSFTITGWVKTSVTTAQYIMTRHNDSTFSAQFNVYMGNDASGVLQFEISPINNASNRLTTYATGNIADNKWHQFSIVYDGSRTAANVKFYVDGLLKPTNVVTNTLSSNAGTGTPGFIGNRGSAGSFFTGIIDEVIIESRAWTAKEVETYYRKSIQNYRQKKLI